MVDQIKTAKVTFEVKYTNFSMDEDGDFTFEYDDVGSFFLHSEMVQNAVVEEIKPPFQPGWYALLTPKSETLYGVNFCKSVEDIYAHYGIIKPVRLDIKIAED